MIGLKNIRKQRNLNQQKVAMDLNISREALSYYENGRREPSLALLVAVMRCLWWEWHYAICLFSHLHFASSVPTRLATRW